MTPHVWHGGRRWEGAIPHSIFLPLLFVALLLASTAGNGASSTMGAASHSVLSPPTSLAFGSQELAAAKASLDHSRTGTTLSPSSAPEFPALREYAAMAWDPAAGYVVLFGGSNITNPDTEGGTPNLDDTWTFSNGSWTELYPSVSPPATDFAAMAYDPNASAAILFGGQIQGSQGTIPVNDTWEYKGGTWTNVTGPVAPSPRLSPALAEDSLRGGLILFGGSQNYPYAEVPESDTWSFVNGTWLNITATVGPPPPARLLAGMTYDPNESGDVLFGGWTDLGGTHPLNDTWILGQTGWTNATIASAPPASGGMALAYLSESGSVILYGGSTPALGYDYNQTWSFSAGIWTRLSPAEVPPGTFAGTFADDSGAGYGVLLLGAETPYAPASEQTWAFAHGNWSLAGANSSLPPAGAGVMVYDPAEQEVVLVPNLGTGFASGSTPTWVYSDGNWTKLTATVAPGTLLVYDGADGYVLGYETTFSKSSTWEFENNSWTELYPSTSPTPGESGGIAYDAHDGYVLYYDYSKGGGNPSTWKWSDGDWTNLNLTTQPDLDATLGPNTMTYDARDGYILLVQGSNLTCGVAGKCLLTWSFSDGNWTDLTGESRVAPTAVMDASITYDPLAQEVLLFGGTEVSGGCAPCGSNQTWAYSGGQWTQILTNATPTARVIPALTFDPFDGLVLMFGGSGFYAADGGYQGYPLADMWGFANDSWTELIPSLSATLPLTDVGVPTVLTTTAPPAFGSEVFSYTGLPGGCQSASMSSITCVPADAGSFIVTVTVGYSGGAQSTASTNLTVADLPLISGFSATENPVMVNATTTLSIGVTGGTAPLTYAYSDLPPGCTSADVNTIECTPTTAGKFGVSVEVTDRFDRSDNSTLILTVGTTHGVTPPGPGGSGALGWFSSPIGQLLSRVLVVGIAAAAVALSAVFVRGRRLRREGEELVDGMHKAITEEPANWIRPP
jgi:hypothetical protein